MFTVVKRIYLNKHVYIYFICAYLSLYMSIDMHMKIYLNVYIYIYTNKCVHTGCRSRVYIYTVSFHFERLRRTFFGSELGQRKRPGGKSLERIRTRRA